MMRVVNRGVNHTIAIRPISVDGIIVYDEKNPKGAVAQQMNKISVIASFSRNRKTQTTLQSRPIVPGVNDRFSLKMNKGGTRYMTLWDEEDMMMNDQYWDEDQQGQDIILETNLHTRSRRDKTLQPKEYEVIVGLKRGEATVVLGVSVLNVYGPQHQMEMELPLCPLGFEEIQQVQSCDESVGVSSFTRERASELGVAWDVEPLRFDDDVARGYKLAKNASFRIRIEVLDTMSKCISVGFILQKQQFY